MNPAASRDAGRGVWQCRSARTNLDLLGWSPLEAELPSMCDKCVELDKKIEHYERRSRINPRSIRSRGGSKNCKPERPACILKAASVALCRVLASPLVSVRSPAGVATDP